MQFGIVLKMLPIRFNVSQLNDPGDKPSADLSATLLEILMSKPLLCAALLLSTQPVFADYALQGIKVSCEEDNATVESFLLLNEHPASDIIVLDDGSSVYYGVDQTFSCKLKNHEIHGTIRNTAGTDPGTCNAVPFSQVTVFVNDKPIFKDQAFKNPNFTNKCYESVNSVSFKEAEDANFALRYCGDTGLASHPHVSGCFEFKDDQYERLAFPLPATPVSSAVNVKKFFKR